MNVFETAVRYLELQSTGKNVGREDLARRSLEGGTAQSLRLRAGTSATISASDNFPASFACAAASTAALFHVDSKTRAPPYHNAS